MSRPRFSKKYRTYGEWLKAQPRDSRYAKVIIRRHDRFPDKSLDQLKEKKAPEYDLSTRAWDSLSKKERKEHRLSLEVLRGMREGESFTHMLKKVGLKKGTVLQHLGKSIYQSGKTWKAKDSDLLQARLRMYTTEGVKVIVTANRKDRILLAQYPNMVTKALENNDPSMLDKFKDLKIIDASGKEHRFETDLKLSMRLRKPKKNLNFRNSMSIEEVKSWIKKLIKNV